MEKFAKKIEQSNNDSSLLHQVFNELELQVAGKLIEANKDVGKLVELRFLWDQCGHSNFAVAYEACQSVTALSLKGHLGIDESITALLTNISTARHYGPLIDSIALLMLRGSYKGLRHPFITLYEMQADSWPYILQHTSSILSSGVFEVQALKDIKSFVIFILCYGAYETQIMMLCLLMEKLHIEKNSSQSLVDWLLEALSWHHIQKTGKNASNFYLICSQHLSQYAIAQKDAELGKMMAIYMTFAMQESHKNSGCSIHHSIILLKQLNDSFTLHLEPIVVLLAQFLLECHANCYEPVLDLCLSLAKKSCNTYVWAMLQCAVLSIFSYSDKIESIVIQIVESNDLSAQVKSLDFPPSTKEHYIQRLARSDSTIQVAIATANLADCLEQEAHDVKLNNLQSSKNSLLPVTVFLLKCALFWRLDNLSALEEAISYVSSTKQHANLLLTLLLKKLTAPSNGQTKLAILYHLPTLAIDKTCVPRILQIFEALSSNQQLKPIRLRLLTELWKNEDRVYPFLDKALTETHQTEEFLVAKALVIDIICSNRSDKYGAEQLSVISELLNLSLGKVNTASSPIIATLALRSLVSLCRAEVVDLKSVWELLSPKLNQDRRDPVVIEMCNLLGLAAELNIDSEEHDEFIQQAISTLFRVSLTNFSPKVRCVALSCLSRFPKKNFSLKCMPDVSKDDLKIPSKYLLSGKSELPLNPEDVLDYVPGTCWMKLLDLYEGEVLSTGYVSLISQLIRKEIENMPIWVYRKAATDATKQNEPGNYATFLKEDSVLAAIVVYMQRICEINPATRLRMSIAMEVLTGPYERPLPPLNWTILLPIAQQNNLEGKFMEIVFAQAPHSFSAQSITEEILNADPLNGEIALIALSYLGSICKAFPPKVVQSFLYRLLNNQQSEMLVILNRLQNSLCTVDPPVSLEIKETIVDILVGYLPILPGDLESARLFSNCFRLVAGPHQPLCDPSITTAKKNILIFLYASQQSQSKSASEYLLKALQLTLYLPNLDTEVMELIHSCVDAHCKTSTNFFLQFLSYIQLTAMRSPDKNQVFSNLMNTLALVVGALCDSIVFSTCSREEDRSVRTIENLWKHFSLSVSRLFNQPQWSTSKRNMQDWICTMLENELITIDQKRSLLDALPSMGGVEKEIFFRVLPSI